jgi:NAD(P)-dependent dehydrogenase (short-subunit alcohol dehydrogenase family)
MRLRIEDKVAFVTGGTSGIGLGIAKALAEKGARVAVSYRREAAFEEATLQLKATQAEVQGVCVDVTDAAAMTAAAAQLEATMGPVHILCNSAGVTLMASAEDTALEDWSWIMDTNFYGVVNGIRAFVPAMKRRGEGGHVLNVGSIASFLPNSMAGAYVASKYAVRGLTESLRLSLAEYGIGVSLLSPGITRSNVYSASLRRDPKRAGTVATESELLARAERHSQGRDPSEVGRTAVEGMLRNELHIVTHPELNSQVLAELTATAGAFRD